MDAVIRKYSTFFFVHMDERALSSFSLPHALDPTENAAKFN